MRIIGEIPHPNLKITVFQMTNKLSVQFESGSYAQTYRLREQKNLKHMPDIQKLVDMEMIQAVEAVFVQMHRNQNAALTRLLPPVAEDEFDEII